MAWYYADSGEQRGPISDSELDEMIATGRISRETLVWQDGMDNWQALETVRSAGAQAPPPVGASPHPYPVPSSNPPATVVSDYSSSICSNCGSSFPSQNLTRIGNIRLCASCLPVIVQQARQHGQTVPAETSTQIRYGGFWIRVFAKSVDHVGYFVFTAPLMIYMMPPDLRQHIMDPGPDVAAAMTRVMKESEEFALQFLPYLVSVIVAYNAFFVSLFSATPGKMLFRLKVVAADLTRVSIPQAISRAMLPGLVLLTGGFGLQHFANAMLMGAYLLVAFDPEKRSLFDFICRTRVIYKR